MVFKHLTFYLLGHVCTFGIQKSEERVVLKSEAYEEIVKSTTYIDKTWFIRYLFNLPQYLVITGPQGFSKTTNLNMLKSFFEHELDETHTAKDPKTSKKLQTFKDKQIFTDEKFFWQHFGKYPVIHLDQSAVTTKNFDEFLKSFVKHCIDPLTEKFGYLWNSTDTKMNEKAKKGYPWTKDDLQEFGAELASLLHHHHGTKPILLIDEYDSPSVAALLDAGVSEKDTEAIVQFLSSFVAEIIQHNHNTFRAVLTGRLALSLIPKLKHRNIFESEKLSSAYGFLEADLNELEKRFAMASPDMEHTRAYYRGYCVYEKPTERIYSSQSIIHSLLSRTVIEYWSGDVVDKLRPLLGAEQWGPALEMCILKRCKITVTGPMKKTDIMQLKKSLLFSKKADPGGQFLFQILVETGYFTVEEKQGVMHTISVPNVEVQTVMMDEFYRGRYLHERYGFTEEDEKHYLMSLDKLSSDVTTLHTLVRSVQTLFRNLAPKDEVFMQVVLLHPLLNCSEFSTYPFDRDDTSISSYAIFAKRWRDHAGILFEARAGPNLDQGTKRDVSNVFEQFPDLKDTVDLRLVVSGKNEVYGFYNYATFGGSSVCELWPPQKKVT
nr:PREDICTED: uncharacterized protein LOC109040094 [Bemisia tabaci]XP_018911441.1 PREDICTED: uncharacterized protein LOC109040094 [Bemisia tabaci]